jgi:preprotein translocase subunit SecG
VAWRLIKYLRIYGVHDNFSRMTCIVAGTWMANIIAFFIFHGDAEYAMKTFSLQAGLLLACRRNLLARLEVEEASEQADEKSLDSAPVNAPRLSPV